MQICFTLQCQQSCRWDDRIALSAEMNLQLLVEAILRTEMTCGKGVKRGDMVSKIKLNKRR